MNFDEDDEEEKERKKDFLVLRSKTTLGRHYEQAIKEAILESEDGEADDAIQNMLEILHLALDTVPTDTK